MVSKFIFNFSNFCVIACFFLIKLLTLGILFPIVVNAVFVSKLLTSGILFSNSVSYAFLIKSVTSRIFFSNSVLSVLYIVFKTKSLVSILFTFAANLSYTVFEQHHFLLHHSVYLNQQELVLICQCLIYRLQFLD